jgi:adenylate cyclase
VRRIVTTANLQLPMLEAGIPASRRPDNLEAYDYYLRGQEYVLTNITKERNAKACQMYEKAIQLDPKYAAAYAGLGFSYFLALASHWSSDTHLWERAFQLEQQALALDASSGLAYLCLTPMYLAIGQYDKSIAAAERAVALDPSSSSGYAFLASALAFSGKPAEALKVLEKARRRDPRTQDASLCLLAEGQAYTLMGRYAEAIPILKRYIARIPDLLGPHLDLAVSYIELGREADARAEAAEILRISPQFVLADPKHSMVKDLALAERRDADLRKAGLK